MPDDETMQQKPPDYESVAGAPPTYDDAIKLNPARLLVPRAEPAADAPAPQVIPGQPDDAPGVHRAHASVPKTPPPPYRPTRAIR